MKASESGQNNKEIASGQQDNKRREDSESVNSEWIKKSDKR